jgi:hypothetical protein
VHPSCAIFQLIHFPVALFELAPPVPPKGNSCWELNSFHGARHVAILEMEAESQDDHLAFPPMVRAW